MITHLSAAGLLLFVALCVLVPIISALLTRAPSWATGALTVIQAAVIGFVAEWWTGGDGYDWKHGLEKALLAVAFVIGARKTLTAGQVEGRAHAKGLQAGPPH